MPTIQCTVQSVKGICSAGLKIGDTFIVRDAFIVENITPAALCLHALAAMAPYLTAFGRQTAESDWINGLRELQCPDSTNSVVFRLQRLR